MNAQEFMQQYNVSVFFERVKFRPGGTAFSPKARHFRATIARPDASWTMYYSLGSGVPDPIDLLERAASDCGATRECKDWADFLVEFGFTNGAASIRNGYEAWNACCNTHEMLKSLFGEQGFDDFMNIDWNFEYELVVENVE